MSDTKKEKKEFNLNNCIYRLLTGLVESGDSNKTVKNEPFFASISQQITKISTKSIPTAGVRISNRHQFELLYNPEWMGTLTNLQQAAVLKHEFYHLILGHVTNRKPEDNSAAKRWNFATDLAINSFLPGELPKACLYPGEGFFKDYPKLKSSEWYFGKINNDKKFQKRACEEGKGTGDQQFDSHDGWGGSDPKEDAAGKAGASTEIAKERLKNILKKAVQDATNQGWGSVSADMKQEIIKSISSKVDWRRILRYFIKTSQRADKSSTVRKINKRFPMIHPGKKINRYAKIAISIDQSGSVSDELLAAFFAELNNLSKFATFVVVPFDHEVAFDDIYEWRKGETRKWERVKCGGTCFDAPTDYVNSRNFDGHIILTDLCAPKPKSSRCQRMWMTSAENANHPYFETHEKVIVID